MKDTHPIGGRAPRTPLRRSSLALALVAVGLTVAPGCSDDDDDDFVPAPASGQLAIQVTDAPADLEIMRRAVVRVEQVLIHAEANAAAPVGSASVGGVGTGQSGWITLFDAARDGGPREFDLLRLRGGVTETLLQASLPAGTYRQLRLVVSGGEVVAQVGSETRTYSTANGNLDVPSGESSGIKIPFANDPIVVVGGLTTELLLDFDVARTFNAVGPPGDPSRFQIQPVIRGVNLSTAGRIAGIVRGDGGTPGLTGDDAPLANATISAIQTGSTTATTLSDAQGVYVLPGLPAGTYQLQVEASGHRTLVVPDVGVVAGNQTTRDVTLESNVVVGSSGP